MTPSIFLTMFGLLLMLSLVFGQTVEQMIKQHRRNRHIKNIIKHINKSRNLDTQIK